MATHAADPKFRVSSLLAAHGGSNAILTTDGTLSVDSPLFTAQAKVRELSGSPAAADWEIGFTQTATSHFLEKRYQHTIERILVGTPIRDSGLGTGGPWYHDIAHGPAVPGGDANVAMEDHPHLVAAWDDPRTAERNALVHVTWRLKLHSWLIATNRLTNAMKFLRNFVWGIDFSVNVNSPRRTAENVGPGMTGPSSSDGQGSGKPVFDRPLYNTKLNEGSTLTPIKGAGASARGSASAGSGSAPAIQLKPEPPNES